MNEIELLNEAIEAAYMALSYAVKDIKEIRKRNGLPEATYNVEVEELVGILKNQGDEEARDYLINLMSMDETAKAVRAFKRKTDKEMHCFTLSSKEIEEKIRQKVENELAINGVDAEIEYIIIAGSRCRGINEFSSADLDVVIEYKGSIKETDMKNMLDTSLKGYEIEGVSIDVMPMASDKHDIAKELADMETYLASSREGYNREMAANIYRFYEGSFNYYNIKAALNSPVESEAFKSLMTGLRSIHDTAVKENPLSYKALKTGEYLTLLKSKANKEKHIDADKKEKSTRTTGKTR